MSPKSLLVCIFCSLMTESLQAKECSKRTIQLSFSKDFSVENISAELTKLGISLDEESSIITRDEKNYINLTCFDCIVRNIDSQEQIRGSFNERTVK